MRRFYPSINKAEVAAFASVCHQDAHAVKEVVRLGMTSRKPWGGSHKITDAVRMNCPARLGALTSIKGLAIV